MEEVDRFLAKNEAGKEYTVILYQEYIDVSSHDFSNAEISGAKVLITDEGLAVSYINPTTFKIVDTGEIIWKI